MKPTYSVIIPAYNEQDWLSRSLPIAHEATEAQAEPSEIIVVDNNSSDRTAQVAQTLGARVVFEPINQISRARNTGARAATGDYLIFLDADTLLPSDLLQAAIGRLSTGQCVGGGAWIRADQPIGLPARILVWGWNRFSWWWGSAAGCFFYCRRDAFEAVGGFSQRLYASEELWLSRALRIWGRANGMRFEVITEPPVITSARKLNHPKNVVLWLLGLLFPLSIFSRKLCAFWYARPGSRR